MKLLSEEEIEANLAECEYWQRDSNAIKRDYTFQDFSEAMDFINMVAVISESHKHHPEIYVKYNQVSLRIYTHELGGLTEMDFSLALDIDKI